MHMLTSVDVMQYLLSSLATMVFIGMLALLAQLSRKSRRAEISLLIVLVFLSLLLFATGALLGVLWVSGQMPPDVYPKQLLALTGDRSWCDDDGQMLELLEPFAGHRWRVVCLLAAAGFQPARRAPRRERHRIAHF